MWPILSALTWAATLADCSLGDSCCAARTPSGVAEPYGPSIGTVFGSTPVAAVVKSLAVVALFGNLPPPKIAAAAGARSV